MDVSKLSRGVREPGECWQEEDMDEGSDSDKPRQADPLPRNPLADGVSHAHRQSPHRMMSAKGITLPMLIEDGIVTPGNSVLTMEYMGQRFVGDLLPNGKIQWPESDEVFNSPSAFAIHCKQLVDPGKKSACGWSAIKYKGKKLEAYKSVWFSKQRANMNRSPFVSPVSFLGDVSRDDSNHSNPAPLESPALNLVNRDVIENTQPAHRSSTTTTNGVHNQKRKTEIVRSTDENWQEEALDLCIRPTKCETKLEVTEKGIDNNENIKNGEDIVKMKEKVTHNLATAKTKKVIKYSSLGKRAEEKENRLVECISFNSIGKVQPFRATVSSNCILLIDFHCHLTSSEVVGYLGGRWDPTSFMLHIQQAFPCRCRLDDKENAPKVENEIRQQMDKKGLTLVGWYHSHPTSPPAPSLRDIDSQVEYQFKMKGPGNMFVPCMGLIVSSYQKGNQGTESTFQGYWVLPAVEQKRTDYGIPMQINYSVTQDNYLTQDVFTEMKNLVDFYSCEKDFINFTDQWEPSWSYLDKLKCSLSNKFPKDQSEGRILEVLDNLLVK